MPLPIVSIPAHPRNYAVGRGSNQVEYIIVHTMEGSLKGTDTWFASPAAKCCSHYGIGFNGDIHQYVSDNDTAYHAGNLKYNLRSIGIELEGSCAKGQFTDPMMKSLADLCSELAAKHGLTLDRTRVIGHNEVPSPDGNGFGGAGHHVDPGSLFPWDQLMKAIDGQKAVV